LRSSAGRRWLLPEGYQVKFGTDGWRGIIADDFTFGMVRLVARAIAEYVVSRGGPGQAVAVGYDTRFMGAEFALQVASSLRDAGLKALLSEGWIPTPALSCAVIDGGLAGGVMVTASHNPARYNGIKFKPPYGGSATREVTDEIERIANALLERGLPPSRHGGTIQRVSMAEGYFRRLARVVDFQLLRSAPLRVAVDPMHGATMGYLQEAFHRAGCEVLAVGDQPNPAFGGRHPEPIAEHLKQLMELVPREGVDLGVACDGDGDRVGLVDEQGNFVNSHQIFAILLIHLVKNRDWRGGVVKTISTTSMIDILARQYQLPLFETPVGFKHICRLMLEKDILMGGEESGGLGFKGHIPERDGILSALLVAERMVAEQKSLAQLIEDLEARVGPHHYRRRDVHVPASAREAILEELRLRPPREVAGRTVDRLQCTDGFKFHFTDSSWLLVRPSGTEPLVRLYAEAADPRQVEAYLDAAYGWLRERAHAADEGI